MICSDTTV